MEDLIVIALYAFFIWWSYKLAEDRGRNGVGYAVAAILFSWLVPVFLFIIGNTAEKALSEEEINKFEEEEAREKMKQELLAELKANQ